ncbi:hypothetical protein RhiJN_08003 [Ceratobasidium sp. AG-Ba]|nr:hypothetical protein RhiJN_07990 [Ceratobasidium sp. AG-Ba]QRV79988.1 hypothetical protein RhiJN_08003 [Ceratobasidium sp. AG-Ba]
MATTTSTRDVEIFSTKQGSGSFLTAVQIKNVAGKTYTFLAAGESPPFNPSLYDKLPAEAVYTTAESILRATNVNWVSIPHADTIVSLTSPDQTDFVGIFDTSRNARYHTVGNTEGSWTVT